MRSWGLLTGPGLSVENEDLIVDGLFHPSEIVMSLIRVSRASCFLTLLGMAQIMPLQRTGANTDW